MRVSSFTYMHHEWYCLHLYWCRGIQPSIFEVLEDAGIKAILGLQLLKRANRVRYIAAVHVDTVLRANAVHLKPNEISLLDITPTKKY